jgi:hypothetical protein
MNKNIDTINSSPAGEAWFNELIMRLCMIQPKKGRKHVARLIGIVKDGFIFENKEGRQWFTRRDFIDEMTSYEGSDHGD